MSKWPETSRNCREMRAQVLQWTGLPTSVGFGQTKTLAKLANHVAKMAERKQGLSPCAVLVPF